jgi:hypothetical protein
MQTVPMQREWDDPLNRILSRLRDPSVHRLRCAQANTIIGSIIFALIIPRFERPRPSPTRHYHLLFTVLLLCFTLVGVIGRMTQYLFGLFGDCDIISSAGGCQDTLLKSSHNSLRSSEQNYTSFGPFDESCFRLDRRVSHFSTIRNTYFLSFARHTLFEPFLRNWRLSFRIKIRRYWSCDVYYAVTMASLLH